MLRSFLAAALFALFVLLAITRGETISVTPQAVPTAATPLDLYDSYAVWGVNSTSQTANLTSGPYISPELGNLSVGNPLRAIGLTQPTNPRWRYSAEGNTFTGAMTHAYTVNPDVVGQGFFVTLNPSEDGMTQYELWTMTTRANAQVVVSNRLGQWVATAILPPDFYGKVGYSASTPESLFLSLTLASIEPGEGPAPGITLGAVTAQVVPVPEPGMSGLAIGAIVLVAALFGWYRLALWIDRKLGD